jgi:hypothetical protein
VKIRILPAFNPVVPKTASGKINAQVDALIGLGDHILLLIVGLGHVFRSSLVDEGPTAKDLLFRNDPHQPQSALTTRHITTHTAIFRHTALPFPLLGSAKQQGGNPMVTHLQRRNGEDWR